MHRLLRPLLIVVAIVFLFEAWLWSHLEPIVERIVARIPFRALKARLAAAIASLPPAATLVVFVVPVALLFPFKLLGLWLLAHKYFFAAGLVLVLAKLAGMGVTAFVFEATRPQLLRLTWFRWLYEHVLAWLAWARVRRQEPNRHETKPGNAQARGQKRQHHHAGDDRGRGQHDADLEGRRGHLVVVVSGECGVAQLLLLDGAARQLERAFALAAAGLRLRAIARRVLGPFVDLLGERRSARIRRRGGELDPG
jgi:hypothetical protein